MATEKQQFYSDPLFYNQLQNISDFWQKNRFFRSNSYVLCSNGTITAKNTVISRDYAETVPFHKISTPGNQVKLRYFS